MPIQPPLGILHNHCNAFQKHRLGLLRVPLHQVRPARQVLGEALLAIGGIAGAVTRGKQGKGKLGAGVG